MSNRFCRGEANRCHDALGTEGSCTNLIARDLPLIPIAHAGIPILMNRKVEGLVPQPDGNERLETVSVR